MTLHWNSPKPEKTIQWINFSLTLDLLLPVSSQQVKVVLMKRWSVPFFQRSLFAGMQTTFLILPWWNSWMIERIRLRIVILRKSKRSISIGMDVIWSRGTLPYKCTSVRCMQTCKYVGFLFEIASFAIFHIDFFFYCFRDLHQWILSFSL